MMTHHILKKAGIKVGLAGNVGFSFAKQVAEEDYEWYVIELSSFQLDEMFDFKADIAMLTNITPDHLDRYDYDMQKYVDSKMRILQNQTAADHLIYNFEDPILVKEIEKRKPQAQLWPFSTREEMPMGGGIKRRTNNHQHKQHTVYYVNPQISPKRQTQLRQFPCFRNCCPHLGHQK